MENRRSVRERFGGDWTLDLGDGCRLNISDAVRAGGPGEGFAMVPWGLDKYEKALRLKPGETWLLKRMLKHAWESNSLVYLSQRKIALQADISRPTLRKYLARLEELGYLRQVSVWAPGDRRKRYSVKGLYFALALCIASDPSSKWSQSNGGRLPKDVVQKWCDSNELGVSFDIDHDAVRLLDRWKPN